MPRPGRDRLSLVDLMVIVGVAAISMGAFRAIVPLIYWESPYPGLLTPPATGWTAKERLARLLAAQVPLLPVVFSWTIVVPILRLAHPNRPRRLVVRQPGVAACLAILLGWGIAAVEAGAMYAYVHKVSPNPARIDGSIGRFFLSYELVPMGHAAAVAWAGLALAGLWRPSRDPVEWLGRAVGAYWILIGLQWGAINNYGWLT